MALVKLSTTIVIQLEFWNSVKDLVLSPISSPALELILFMLVVPFFVNLLIFWVTDNFLMRHDHQKKSFLINYVSKANGGAGNGDAGINGKSLTKNLLQRTKLTHSKHSSSTHQNHYNPSNNGFDRFLNENDSESDALISGDESFIIDDTDAYGDRIALERFAHGMGSTSSLESSSARRHHRNSFIVNS